MVEPVTDPIERIVADGLTTAGIKWERGKYADFDLPDYMIGIEVKQFPTERSARQLARAENANIILIQGRAAAKAFVSMLSASRRQAKEEDAKIAEDFADFSRPGSIAGGRQSHGALVAAEKIAATIRSSINPPGEEE